MKKKPEVIGYQPDRLCTFKDLEKFDTIWWANKPNEPLKKTHIPNNFKLSFAAKEAFTRGISLFKL